MELQVQSSFDHGHRGSGANEVSLTSHSEAAPRKLVCSTTNDEGPACELDQAFGPTLPQANPALTLEYVPSDTESDDSSQEQIHGFRARKEKYICNLAASKEREGTVLSKALAGSRMQDSVERFGGSHPIGVSARKPSSSCLASNSKPSRQEKGLSKLEKLEKQRENLEVQYHGKGFGPTLRDRKGSSGQQAPQSGWFSMPSTKLTEEIKRDLTVLSLRNCFSSKSFYKSDRRRGVPKWFQIGSIIDDPAAPSSHRLPKGLRKQSLAEQLLDEGTQEHLEKRFRSIQRGTRQRTQVLKRNYPGLSKHLKGRRRRK